ncbi:MAG: 3-isopropylmalate dehydratase large subunit [Candidatus Schekmanbacteria bacterium RBG_16_38_10]|uniref:3-isopropylmalate dehydratase large subunit n=1 Tax=Candidatus Schekmanbacteria bacterium RBG_16_38_10 TaxID=1817879 RepID=A0A1F7RZL3_9BACT|nr:MAG: 3-isopropylmalate dehydratase large subunit [Candidatus Schekmanbacteria bacterium RBG_16_38_10]
MGMTITEKILASHASAKKVQPGEIVNCKTDILLGNDITAPIAINLFEKSGAKKVFDRKKIVFVPDHFAPNKDIESATQCKKLRDFSKKHRITNYFEVGRMGIEHALLPEKGIVLPGDLVIGADSHTCTYGALGAFSTGIGSTDLAAAMITGKVWLKVPQTIKFNFFGKLNKWVSGKDLILYTIGNIGVDGANYRAMEFCGEVIKNLNMDNRLTICNMAIEAGAKNGIIAPDAETLRYIKKRAIRKYKLYNSDKNASYEEILEFNCSKIEPQVAFPHSPENTKPVSEAAKVKIDQVIIGSCTNGRITDLIEAAKILKGKKVNPNVRLLIFPATQEIYKEAMKMGIINIFIDAEAVVSTPTCGPCLGGHMGILAEGERAVATTNRNFVGRMGHAKSEIYLASPAVAAASAIKGRIASPEEVVKK